jgi:hypothetical protein
MRTFLLLLTLTAPFALLGAGITLLVLVIGRRTAQR